MSDCCDPIAAPTAAVGIALLFTTGVTISLGHCLGMCGPIVSTYTISQARPGRSTTARIGSLARYHAGRIAGYVAIGGVFGFLGSLTLFAQTTQKIQGLLSLLVALLMLLLGFGLLGWVPTQRWIEGLAVSRRITDRIGGLLSSDRGVEQFGLGVANGFLPCGPVVAVALASAATTSPFYGMLAMAVYGLGTVPALVILGVGINRLSPRLRLRFFRIGIVLVIVIGLQLALRGLAVFDLVGHLRLGEVVLW